MNLTKMTVALATLLILTVGTIWTVDIYTVQGHEIGVLETWGGGVESEPLPSKTYVFFPGFTKKLYMYDTSSQVFVMNDLPDNEETGEGRNSGYYWETYDAIRQDSYLVQSREGQDMYISMNVRWRLDPLKIVELHRSVRGQFEEKLIRPVLMRVVKDEATTMDAIAAYSGEGLVTLQTDIFKRLIESELSERGIIVENFVIEYIKLDPQYIEEIKLRQVAVQRELRAVQEEKAALAEAQKAKAEAEAKMLQLQAYAVEGADEFVKIEVSKNIAEAFKNIRGYLPESMKLNVLTESFNQGVKAVVDAGHE